MTLYDDVDPNAYGAILYACIAYPLTLFFGILFWRRRMVHPIRGRHPRLVMVALAGTMLLNTTVLLDVSLPVLPCGLYWWMVGAWCNFAVLLIFIRCCCLLFQFSLTADSILAQQLHQEAQKKGGALSTWSPSWYTARRHWLHPKFWYKVIAGYWALQIIFIAGTVDLSKFPSPCSSDPDTTPFIYVFFGFILVVAMILGSGLIGLAILLRKHSDDGFGLKVEFRWLGLIVVGSASCGVLWVILRVFAPDWQNSVSGRIMQNRVDWALAGSCTAVCYTMLIPPLRRSYLWQKRIEQIGAISSLSTLLDIQGAFEAFASFCAQEFTSENLYFFARVRELHVMGLPPSALAGTRPVTAAGRPRDPPIASMAMMAPSVANGFHSTNSADVSKVTPTHTITGGLILTNGSNGGTVTGGNNGNNSNSNITTTIGTTAIASSTAGSTTLTMLPAAGATSSAPGTPSPLPSATSHGGHHGFPPSSTPHAGTSTPPNGSVNGHHGRRDNNSITMLPLPPPSPGISNAAAAAAIAAASSSSSAATTTTNAHTLSPQPSNAAASGGGLTPPPPSTRTLVVRQRGSDDGPRLSASNGAASHANGNNNNNGHHPTLTVTQSNAAALGLTSGRGLTSVHLTIGTLEQQQAVANLALEPTPPVSPVPPNASPQMVMAGNLIREATAIFDEYVRIDAMWEINVAAATRIDTERALRACQLQWSRLCAGVTTTTNNFTPHTAASPPQPHRFGTFGGNGGSAPGSTLHLHAHPASPEEELCTRIRAVFDKPFGEILKLLQTNSFPRFHCSQHFQRFVRDYKGWLPGQQLQRPGTGMGTSSGGTTPNGSRIVPITNLHGVIGMPRQGTAMLHAAPSSAAATPAFGPLTAPSLFAQSLAANNHSAAVATLLNNGNNNNNANNNANTTANNSTSSSNTNGNNNNNGGNTSVANGVTTSPVMAVTNMNQAAMSTASSTATSTAASSPLAATTVTINNEGGAGPITITTTNTLEIMTIGSASPPLTPEEPLTGGVTVPPLSISPMVTISGGGSHQTSRNNFVHPSSTSS